MSPRHQDVLFFLGVCLVGLAVLFVAWRAIVFFSFLFGMAVIGVLLFRRLQAIAHRVDEPLGVVTYTLMLIAGAVTSWDQYPISTSSRPL